MSKNKVANCSEPKAKRAEEYLIMDWDYKSWSGMYRYSGPDADRVRETIAQVAIKAANNNKIGYSQGSRLTYYNNLKKHGYDPSKITSVCHADCSSSTAANVIAAGHICNISKLKKVDPGMSTGSAYSVLSKAGFKHYTSSKYTKNVSNLKRGDLLHTSGHITIFVGNAKSSGSLGSSSGVTLVSKPKNFKQGDPKWGNKKVGDMTCTNGGCGPTAVADVVAALINKKYNPGVVFDYCKDKGYIIAGAGTTRIGITKCLTHYGIKSKDIKYSESNWNNAVAAAKASGKWVLSLMSGPSMWAAGSGHYVVIYKADKNHVYVTDPSGRDVKKATISQYTSRLKAYWIIDVSDYGGTSSDDGFGVSDDGGAINLQQAIAKLYTSDNYQWLTSEEKKENLLVQSIKASGLETIKRLNDGTNSSLLNDNILKNIIKLQAIEIKQKKINDLVKKEKKLVKGNLASFPNLVEAPFIEVNLNGITIGGYNHQEDKYPNHINSLEVEKINGRINTYTINITHQVRAGEDPNFIDSLLSRTGVRNKVKIKYGDSAYNAFYKEEEAYILDVTYSESVTSSSINYTITAVSSVGSIQTAYYNFSGVESKPSTQIINMLYNNKYTSNQLLSVLGGMSNKTQVLSSGLIPTDDKSLWIPGGDNMSLVERLQQLVSYMQDPTDITASYFLSYEDNKSNNSIFKITKVKKTGTSGDALKNCYYLDVGYPGDSFVTNFNIENNVYWPIYFKYAGKFDTYKYDIDYTGKLITTKVNPLTISDRYQTIDTKKMNWWNFVSSYPISATVTIKGLMKPVILMENVYIYAQFYGKQDMATGLYSIIGQRDSISGNGYSTTLQLLRVQN